MADELLIAEILASYRKRDLRGADLFECELQSANLSFANLESVDLSGSDLSQANLSGAILSKTNLSYANLTGANLNAAVLVDTNFQNANLTQVNLEDARMRDVLFLGSRLGEAKGLEKVIHEGPSHIDFQCIQKSTLTSDHFLRGCGVSNPIIEYLPAILNDAITYYSCFISYSHEDKSFAERLHDKLQGKGVRCWLDSHEIKPGDDIHYQIDRGIRVWDKVLLCASKASLNSWWVDNEIDKAFSKEAELFKQRGAKVWSLIPLNLDNYMFQNDDWGAGKASQVKSRFAADFVGWKSDYDKFESEVDSLLSALDIGRGKDKEPRSLL